MPLNPSQTTAAWQVLAPRDNGRGVAERSTGALSSVDWVAGQVRVDSTPLFNLAVAPLVLDLSFDTVDRPVVCWETPGGVVFVYFFDPVAGAYVQLNCGAGKWPAVCNDYALLGFDIKLVYLISNVCYFREHVTKFATAYQLQAGKLEYIKLFGRGVVTRSLNVVGPLIPA